MCGRFRLSRHGNAIVEDFAVEEPVEWSPRYNIAPTDNILTIRQDRSRPVRKAASARWGLIPYWAKDPAIGYRMINAVAETASSKAAFSQPMRSRRCLIPAEAFYEWKQLGPKQKQPYSFGMADDSLFAFAGLWDRWKDPNNGILETCTVLTTEPNSLVSDIHDRMPAILHREDYDLWLDPGIEDPNRVADLLRPFDARLMKRYPVSMRVNSVKNDDPECAQEIRLPESQERSLFQ